MKSTFIFIAFILFIFPAFCQLNYSPETLEKIKEVETNITGNLILNNDRPSTILERMLKHNVKGLSIAVIHNYKIAWAKAYGWADEAEKKLMTTETLFEPGSISKSLNAVGILKLAQDKKVDLDADINTYLTSWKFPYDSLSNGKKITLAHLLCHTAGLSTHGFPGHDIHESMPTVIQVLDGDKPAVTPAVRSMFEPGLKFQYSGGGTTISQLILTDVTGQSYDSWMYENVLKPIGMVNSTYAQPPAKEKQHLCASGYSRDGSPVSNKFHVYPEQAAAGLWMTPSDLCHYIIDMQLAYEGKSSNVLSPEMVKLHLTPYNNGPTAMGTFIQDHDGALYFEHGAGNDGFCGDFYGSLADGYGVVIFLNNEEGAILNEVINSVAKAYDWKNFYRAPRHKKSIDVSGEIVSTYEGIYVFENSWAAIGKQENEYKFFTSQVYVDMHFSTPTLFFNEEFLAEKEMIIDADGKITGYKRTVEGKAYPNATKVTNPDTLTLDKTRFEEIAWYLMENKKFREASAYFRRGTELYPEDLNMAINLGHSYLYSNKYKSAIAIYRSHLTESVRPGYTWKDLLQDDLAYFTRKNYDVKVFDKIFKKLRIKKT